MMAKQKKSKNDIQKDQNKGITVISVQGFKSLANESRIEVRPLTILAGANSSGKSSIIQPLLLMKQTLEASYDPGPLLLNGPNAKFTSVNQFISRLQKNSDSQKFSIAIENAERNFILKNVFSFKKDQTVEIREMVIGEKEGKRVVYLRPNQSSGDLVNSMSKFREGGLKLPEGVRLAVVRKQCFLDIVYEVLNEKTKKALSRLSGFSERGIIYLSTYELIDKALRGMIHVPGLRGNPERVYLKTATGPDFPGTFEHYVATIIADWERKRDDRLKRLEAMLTDLGLTWKISAKPVNDTQIELQVGRLSKARRDGGDLVSIADVGFGVSQVLPVLVALLVAEPGQLVYLEQPELHLHPRAQYALAKILAETAKRGVKLVVETHSALLLLNLQTLVAKGDLDPNLVKLHWFSRSDEDGTTSIESADLDKNGAFGDWPEDFGDIEWKAEGAYLDAVEGRSK